MSRITAFHRDLLIAFPDIEREGASILAREASSLSRRAFHLIDGALEIANTLIGGFGIEALRDNQWGEYFLDIGVLYVNTGDTYSSTVLYDTRKHKFYVTTYGDYIEAEERRGRRFQ